MKPGTALSGGLMACAALAICSGLTACGSDVETPVVDSSTPVLAEGGYAVTASGDTASTGEAFYRGNGSGFVVLSDEAATDTSNTVLYVTGASGTRRVTGASTSSTSTKPFIALTFARTTALSTTPLTASSLSGSYDVWLAGQTVGVAVAADGTLSTTGGNACALSGKLDIQSSYGTAIAASVTVGAGCKQAAGTYSGLAWAGTDAQPSRWRLVAENGQTLVDMLAYR